jgi:iron complex transport system substrate-binding protein
MDLEALATVAVDCGYKLHERLGPGLLESVYEAIMFESLVKRGLSVQRQLPIPIVFDDLLINEGFRADLMIEGKLLVELKSVQTLALVHKKQVLTYLRLMEMPLGLLINFGAATFKEGVRRIVNNHTDFASSRLRVR